MFGAGAVGGSAPQATQDIGRHGASLLDYGAWGDGRNDDSAALSRALLENGGGVVFAPPRTEGYVLDSAIEIPARTRLVFMAGANQLVRCRHREPLFTLRSAAQIDGGDFRAVGGTSACFVFPSGTGQQRLSNIVAVEGWGGPVLDFAATGGAQSRVENFSVFTAGRGADSFAVRIAERPPGVAVPRHFSNGHFNGGASFDFGGCSIVMIDGVYCGDLRFSNESRGVLMSRSRVGNQRQLVVRGHNHLLDAGWMPQVHLAPGADNCEIRGFFNSGPVIDASGNGRNTITYPASAVPLSVTADNVPLSGIDAATAMLSRTGALYRLEFACSFDASVLGARMLYVGLPRGAPTSAVVDQWNPATIERSGKAGYLPIQLRVLPVNAGRQAMIAYREGVPVTGATLGPGQVRLTGTVTYSA